MSPSDRITALPAEITDDSVRWRIPRDWAPDGVRLDVDWIRNADPEFGTGGDWWTYLLARPAADRFEYRLELRGGRGLGTDPTNPHSWYSANPDYLDHLADVVLPALRGRVNVAAVVGSGSVSAPWP